jgi:hypothetical protein
MYPPCIIIYLSYNIKGVVREGWVQGQEITNALNLIMNNEGEKSRRCNNT